MGKLQKLCRRDLIMNYIYYGQELYHHGILGQKWGLRRYQNEDGTYTEEGRLRYFSKDNSLTKYGHKEFKKINKDFKKSNKQNTKKILNEFGKKQNEIAIKAIDDVKKHDPNIGAVVIMNDGRAYTSRQYKDAINNGLYVKKINLTNLKKQKFIFLEIINSIANSKYKIDENGYLLQELTEKNEYDDIINLSHHVSKKHKQMSLEERSAQFAPFAALTGYSDVVKKTAKDAEELVLENEKNELYLE